MVAVKDEKWRQLYAVIERATLSEHYREGSNQKGLVFPWFLLSTYSRRGFLLSIIVGNQGVGKSLYSFRVAKHYLEMIGRMPRDLKTESEKLQYIVDNYTVFLADELKQKIKAVKWRNRYPVLIWDDAGIFGSSYLFFLSKKKADTLNKLLQIMRSRTAVLIMTTPNPNLVFKAAREIPERIIVIGEEYKEWISRMTGYRHKFTPKGQDLVKTEFVDLFYKRVPDDFFDYYMEKRDSYVDIVLSMEEEMEQEQEAGARKEAQEQTPVDVSMVLTQIMKNPRKVKALLVMKKLNDVGIYYVSSDKIAEAVGVLPSYLRTYIVPSLRELGLIESKHRTGYRLTELGKLVAQTLEQMLSEQGE